MTPYFSAFFVFVFLGGGPEPCGRHAAHEKVSRAMRRLRSCSLLIALPLVGAAAWWGRATSDALQLRELESRIEQRMRQLPRRGLNGVCQGVGRGQASIMCEWGEYLIDQGTAMLASSSARQRWPS